MATQLVADLTEPQRDAVTHVEGPLLVLAGPGSGKTTVVTRRVAHLIDLGIPAWQILALTFTNKAAGEMRDRIAALLPDGPAAHRGLTVSTFHAFCARLLRRYGERVGCSPRFTIYDASDQKATIKQAIVRAELNERNFNPSAVAATISDAKNRLIGVDQFEADAHDFFSRSVAKAYRAYQALLDASSALDFDDLLLRTANLLRGVDDVRDELQRRYEYLLVDEYQDTNHAQFVIAATLGARSRNVCVVGDPDQSIYGWRGADVRNILEFEQQYPETRVIPLGQNFRSTGHIVRAADTLIRNNLERKPKTLHTELGDGHLVRTTVARDERHEAELLVDLIRERAAEDVPWREMAVLYRMNALSRVVEDAMRDARIPYIIARGTAFYDRKEVKDGLSYLRLILNPDDGTAFRRVVNAPPRGIGKTTLDRLDAFARTREMTLGQAARHAGEVQGLTARAVAALGRFVSMLDAWRAEAATHADGDTDLAALVDRVLRESGLEGSLVPTGAASEADLDRRENLEELINAAAQFVAPAEDAGDEPPREETVLDRLAAWLESVALVSDQDAVDSSGGAVTLMTLHAAKGLEFDTVTLVGLEQGILPHSRAAQSDHELEEERRLCFVGMTRAKRFLHLTRATVRTQRGLRERTVPSQFLGELPADTLDEHDHADVYGFDPDPFLDPGVASRGGRYGDIVTGVLVRHPTFGLGRIDAVMPRAMGASARVTFERVGTKTLNLEYAKLERVDEYDL